MRIFSAALIFGLAVTAQAQASALTPQHWYLPAKPGQWCAYPSEIAWQKASDAAFLSDSASAYVADGQVRSLRIFRSDEGGDWGLTDDYAFQDGVVVAVTRTYNSFEKGRVVDDFVLRDGKLVHAARRYFTMYGQPMRPKKAWITTPTRRSIRVWTPCPSTASCSTSPSPARSASRLIQVRPQSLGHSRHGPERRGVGAQGQVSAGRGQQRRPDLTRVVPGNR
jgi:hypothetical protein